MDPNQLTIAGILVAALAAGLAKKWVWGYQLVDMTKDRDFWRDAALAALRHTDRALDVAEKKTDA